MARERTTYQLEEWDYLDSVHNITRQRNISATGFSVFLQEEEFNLSHSPGHKPELIGFIAIKP